MSFPCSVVAKGVFELCEVVLNLLVMVDKLIHYFHVTYHSYSLFLEDPRPLPNLVEKHDHFEEEMETHSGREDHTNNTAAISLLRSIKGEDELAP